MIYWIFLIIIIFIIDTAVNKLNIKNKKKTSMMIIGFILILFVGLRFPKYERVYDLEVYYDYYYKVSLSNSFKEAMSIDRFEIGYVLINYLLSRIIKWNQIILLFHAAVSIIPIFVFIYRRSSSYILSIFFFITLGVLGLELTAFRQSFALMFILLSIKHAEDQSFLKFIFYIFLASLFHKTAIVFIVIYFHKLDYSKGKSILKNLSLVIFILIFSEGLLHFANTFFGYSYSGYVGNRFGGVVQILINLFTLLLMFYYRDNKSVRDNKTIVDSKLLTINFFWFLFYILRYQILILERIAFYFSPALIILLPNILNLEPNRKLRIVLKVGVTILIFLLFIYRLSYSDYGQYRFYFTKH